MARIKIYNLRGFVVENLPAAMAAALLLGGPLCACRGSDLDAPRDTAQATQAASKATGASASGSQFTGKMAWALGGVLGIAGVAGVTMLLRRGRGRKSKTREHAERRLPAKPEQSQAPVAPNGTAAASPVNGHSTNGSTHAKARNGSNHVVQGAGRRRRTVDYTRYFMALRSAVSDHSAHLETESVAAPQDLVTWPGQAAHTHGQNGSHNGNGLHAEVIVQQRLIIEEQQRLIREQMHLIEEKSKLLKEKTELIARQSQLLDEHLVQS